MEQVGVTMPTILCCNCGVEITQNSANMCVACIRENIDITEGINKQLTIHSCRSCGRFLCPPWQSVSLESKELMAACLRKVAGLSKVKLVDAVWIWTEPHSMRLKIKITIQKEIFNGAVLQQAAIIDFAVRNQQCNNCEASYAQGAWQAVVQVRQRVTHKRTFLFLEQLLLKYNAHSDCINIVTFKDGMDFYFRQKQDAVRFIDFLSSHVPTRAKYSRKLISADHKSNVGKFKHNHIVEIVPVCKDDLLVLPAPLAHNLSDINPLVLVKAVSAGVHLVDPLTGERQEMNAEKYWRHEFLSAMTSRDLVRFVVLSLEPILAAPRASAKRRGVDRKLRMAECVVARERDFGVTDTQFTCITHLGHILKEGDTVLGYDLTNAHWSEEAVSLRADLPDVVLVRKFYASKGDRKWALKNLDVDEEVALSGREAAAVEEDYELFMQELEADREMRAAVNLYKAPTLSYSGKQAGGGGRGKAGGGKAGDISGAAGGAAAEAMVEAEEDLDDEEVRLDELLDDLTLALESSDVSEELKGEKQLITTAVASATPGIELPTSGFDVADLGDVAFKIGKTGGAKKK